MRYTYNEVAALRQSASFLGFLTTFLTFLGGYFSGQRGRWWMGFFVLIIFWLIHQFLIPEGDKGKPYDKLVRLIVSSIITLIFLLVFWAGYASAPGGRWWLGLVLIIVYFLLLRFIAKPRK